MQKRRRPSSSSIQENIQWAGFEEQPSEGDGFLAKWPLCHKGRARVPHMLAWKRPRIPPDAVQTRRRPCANDRGSQLLHCPAKLLKGPPCGFVHRF